MKKGKLLVVEGTDCSGKETQSKLLKENIQNMGISVFEMQFPRYDTPTGKIIGGPYLGKEYICDSYFNEGASLVDGRVASLYYAADRLYNKEEILKHLNNGECVILDRYVESNMAHQGGKFEDVKAQDEMFNFIETLEYKMLDLPKPDAVIFLHMPYEAALILKSSRNEGLDGHERDPKHLKQAENTYLRLAKKYDYRTVECTSKDKIKSIDEIQKEVLNIACEVLDVKQNN